MSFDTKCPFCGHPHTTVQPVAAELMKEHLANGVQPVAVCYGCYEILEVTETGLAKPSWETYAGLMASGQMEELNAIRRVGERVREKRVHELPVSTMWAMFRDRTLQHMVPWPAKEGAEAVMRHIFMCGVKAGLVAYGGTMDASTSEDDFRWRMAFIDDELEFMKADAQTFMERKAQRERTKKHGR